MLMLNKLIQYLLAVRGIHYNTEVIAGSNFDEKEIQAALREHLP